MVNCRFNLRKAKSDSETSINCVIRWDSLKLVYPTNLKINPKYWQSDKLKSNYQRAINTKTFSSHLELNAQLDNLHNSVKKIYLNYKNNNQNQVPSKLKFKEILDEKFNPNFNFSEKTILGFIEQYIESSKIRINPKTGNPIASGTIVSYTNLLDRLIEYSNIKRKRVDFDTIDLDFYDDFKEFMILEKTYATNTVARYFKTLKTLLNEATERGLNTNMAYKSRRFQIDKEETENIYLTDDELEEIYNLDLSDSKRLDNARDLFLVGCFTGLRFSDYQMIKTSDISSKGTVELRQQKTKKRIIIALVHPIVVSIMNKYKGKTHNSLPRPISNQKLNNYIKQVGERVKSLHKKVEKNQTKGGLKISILKKKYMFITTHTARRSFASNLVLSGISYQTIMIATGHQSEKSFRNYVKIEPEEQLEPIIQLYRNLNLKAL